MVDPTPTCVDSAAAPLLAPADAATLLAQIAQLLPALAGTVARPATPAIQPGEAGLPAVGTLLSSLRQRHPEAGPHYWGSRAWSLVIWQPVYLAALSVHLAHRLPAVEQIAQQGQPCLVSGFTLASGQLLADRPERLVPVAAGALARLAGRLLPLVQRRVPLHPKMAGRLLADCVLAALLLVQRCDPRLDNRQLSALAPAWLHGLGVPDGSSLQPFETPGMPVRLVLQRKVCCQNFRCRDGELCSTCPKLSREERQARLSREMV